MPSASTGETLSERAQRILGVDLDEWLAEAESSSEKTPATRSEQIAHAQRRHRKRTQSYISALEQEVLQLRSREKALTSQLQTLQEQVQLQSTAPVDIHSGAPSLGFSSHTGSPASEQIRFDLPQMEDLTPECPCCIKGAEETPPSNIWAPWEDVSGALNSADANNSSYMPFEQNPNLSAAVQPNLMADNSSSTPLHLTPQKGVDFILRLEARCMPHLKYATTKEPVAEGFQDIPYNFGTNHCYNLSTRLYRDWGEASLMTPSNGSHAYSITAADLKDLHDASERLQLAEELTPVQIWALICKLDSESKIDPAVLDAFCNELAKHSYCNSFGSAVSKRTVKAALQYYLGWKNAPLA